MEEELKKIREILEGHEQRIVALEKAPVQEQQNNKKFSIKEFLLDVKPQNDVQKTVACGFYLEKHRDLASFNAKDIETVFREAREIVPENINYKIIKCIEKGWVMEHNEKKDKLKSFVITARGESIVNSGFGGKNDESKDNDS